MNAGQSVVHLWHNLSPWRNVTSTGGAVPPKREMSKRAESSAAEMRIFFRHVHTATVRKTLVDRMREHMQHTPRLGRCLSPSSGDPSASLPSTSSSSSSLESVSSVVLFLRRKTILPEVAASADRREEINTDLFTSNRRRLYRSHLWMV